MLSEIELQKLRDTDIDKADRSELVDINGLSVDMELPFEERLESFRRQIKNPYCFLYGGFVIKISYSEDGPSFDEGVINYFSSRKNK